MNPNDAKDAARWRALAPYLKVARHDPSAMGHKSWTCWLELACVPYRSQTEDPAELVDQLFGL